MTAIRDKQRRGHTLVEMIVVISVWSVLLGGVAVLMSSLWRIEHASRDHTAMLNSISRLADQFRADAHSARTATLSSDQAESAADGLTMNLASGERIEYRAEAGRVNREERLGDEVKRRESYAFTPDGKVHFEIGKSGRADLLSLSITRALDPDLHEPSEKRTTRIDAAVATKPNLVSLIPQP
jgi:type II secretory pathway component PulJ